MTEPVLPSRDPTDQSPVQPRWHTIPAAPKGSPSIRTVVLCTVLLVIIAAVIFLRLQAPVGTVPVANTTAPVPASASPVPAAPLSPPPETVAAPQATPPGVPDPVLVEQEVHAQVNRIRAEHGIPELGTDPALVLLARAHSRDMAARGYFGHRNLQEWDATARGAAAGYTCYRDAGHAFSSAIAENLFAVPAGEPLVQQNAGGMMRYPATEAGIAAMAVDAWIFSPGHRKNLLDRGAAREGIGVATGARGLVFITEDIC